MSSITNVPVTQLYKRTEIIGRGKFGVVYKGIHRATNQVVAIKVLNLDTVEDEVRDVQQEIQFLSQLRSVPNVTHYHGSYLNNTRLWIVMDHCAGGSMRTLLRPGPIEERYIAIIVRELLYALQAVHKAGVIHRDIKAANVLITNEGNVQLCDFGVAAQLTATALKRTTMAGTPYWMAPEVIMDGQAYNFKADIWSLGITIYEFATGNPPYSDKDAMRAMQLITSHEPPRLEGRNHSPMLKEIIALCLDESPDSRPMADDLLKTKLIRTYKPQPNSILKELISRYLLWREKKSSRDSVGVTSLEDDLDTSMVNVEEAGELDVKWDFDSLSSQEYIMENDINLNNIHEYATNDMSPVHNREDFMTNKHPTYMTNIGSTVREDPTLRAGTTIHATRKEAPKSLLQLFDESQEVEEEAELPPKLDTAASTLVEIEIPSMDELSLATPVSTVSEPPRRPRASTLQQHNAHSQPTASSVSYLDLRNLNKDEMPANLQRRPTLATSTVQASHSQPPMNHRRTPSPAKHDGLMFSPTKQGTTPPHMKPLNTSMPPLLQPINSNKDGLRIQTPMPRAPPNLSALDGTLKDDINQFGVNPMLVAPKVMTPLTEKQAVLGSVGSSPPQTRGHSSSLSRQQPSRKTSVSSDGDHASRSSSVMGQTATSTMATTPVSIESKISGIGSSLQALAPGLFLDNSGSTKQHLSDEISGLLSKITSVLDIMEEELA